MVFSVVKENIAKLQTTIFTLVLSVFQCEINFFLHCWIPHNTEFPLAAEQLDKHFLVSQNPLFLHISAKPFSNSLPKMSLQTNANCLHGNFKYAGRC